MTTTGAGIVECEIIQWFVEPEARVEEFSPLCEVQSDKASVEITSRFSGVVKKLYYETGEMAKVGKPFVDIDIQGEVKKEDLEALTPSAEAPKEPSPQPPESTTTEPQKEVNKPARIEDSNGTAATDKNGRARAVATPAVRHLSKELDVDISQVSGTGKDGRVLKEDLYKFAEARSASSQPLQQAPASLQAHEAEKAGGGGAQTETRVQLTNTQLHMFKAMTRSLTIPHFLYADEIDFTKLCELRDRLNRVLAKSSPAVAGQEAVSKLSFLPFIIKAVSMALYQYPTLNARVEVANDAAAAAAAAAKPALVLRSQHNIGVAMDTPSGLLVPVIRGVNDRNVLSIARELLRLQGLARAGRLSPHDLSGGTITVSNIGSIGGTYLSPVIVEREVAILGIGRVRAVPAFDDTTGDVVRKHMCNFSWSADHRVIDGATMARAAGVVRQVVEEPDVMVMQLR